MGLDDNLVRGGTAVFGTLSGLEGLRSTNQTLLSLENPEPLLPAAQHLREQALELKKALAPNLASANELTAMGAKSATRSAEELMAMNLDWPERLAPLKTIDAVAIKETGAAGESFMQAYSRYNSEFGALQKPQLEAARNLRVGSFLAFGGAMGTNYLLDRFVFKDIPSTKLRPMTGVLDVFGACALMVTSMNPWMKGASIVGLHSALKGFDYLCAYQFEEALR